MKFNVSLFGVIVLAFLKGVVSDIEVHKVTNVLLSTSPSSQVQVFPMALKVYQSALNQKIQIIGSSFTKDMVFNFEPELIQGVDYELEIANNHQTAFLSLKKDMKWRKDGGSIIVKSVIIDKHIFHFGGDKGIRVAIVLADPVVLLTNNPDIHESQTKVITIGGKGFPANAADIKLNIRPVYASSYKISIVDEERIKLLLQPNKTWLPSFMSLKNEEHTWIRMEVVSVDTGAGEVVLSKSVKLGTIVKDRTDLQYPCDDSCEFAFDGVCDDGSVDESSYYYSGAYDTSSKKSEKKEDLPFTEGSDDSGDYHFSACVGGTDCSDCGGVDGIPSKNSIRPTLAPVKSPLKQSAPDLVTCTNTCIYPRDGVCDDPRGTKYCELGTDCQDCGPLGADNFTHIDDTNKHHNEPLVPPKPPLETSNDDQVKRNHTQTLYALLFYGSVVMVFTCTICVGCKLFKMSHVVGVDEMARYAQLDMKEQTSEMMSPAVVDLEMSAMVTNDERKKRAVAPQDVVYMDEQ